MIGAIIGDIVGSVYEFNNIKEKDFQPFFAPKSFPTDDSIMTVAVADAILKYKENPELMTLEEQTVRSMLEIGRKYPNCGYGGHFYYWMFSDDQSPYGSYGNGAAMRVSACGWAAESLEEAKELSRAVTCITHNHPDGLKGAEATTVAIYMALHGASIDEIREEMNKYYGLDFTIDEIRPMYEFEESCRGTVPPAIEAFLESTSFEDAIRTAISLGGDSDTLAAITGGIAEAYYGVYEPYRFVAESKLDRELREVIRRFEREYPGKNYV